MLRMTYGERWLLVLEIVLGLIAPRGFKSRILRHLPAQTTDCVINRQRAFRRWVSVCRLAS